jgi:hypothetical protein
MNLTGSALPAWDVLADLHEPTRGVNLALGEIDRRTGRPRRVLASETQRATCAAMYLSFGREGFQIVGPLSLLKLQLFILVEQ